MSLTVGGVDVAALTAASFATPGEADAFTLGVLHGLDAAARQLEADAAAIAAAQAQQPGDSDHAAALTAAAERIRHTIADRLPPNGAQA